MAAPPGRSGVPDGEGCYQCDTDDVNGIPLSKPLERDASRRAKRDVSAADAYDAHLTRRDARTADDAEVSDVMRVKGWAEA